MAVEIKALFDESRGSAGKRTLKARLKSKGIEVGLALIRQLMKQQGLIQSMSRRGNCWDNAPMERWFRSFKYEWMLKGGYSSLDEAKEDIKQYVFYYNRVRPHSYNQGLPPVLAKKPIRD